MKPEMHRQAQLHKPTPSRVLAELEAQHDAIRKLIERCEALADAMDEGSLDVGQLTREVVRLRVALDSHNTFEEQLLGPVLREEDAFAEVRIGRMMDDHVGEHRAMRARLSSTETRVLRETLQMLRGHLDNEEQYLLNAKVLHDDLISLDGGG